MKCVCSTVFWLFLVAGLITDSAAANDPLIVTRSFPVMSGGGARLDTVGLILGVDEPGSALGEGRTTLLFDQYFWTNDDQGAIAIADAATDDDFAHVTSILSNGSNDRVWIGTLWHRGDGFSGGGGPESWFFFADLAGTVATDLQNFRLSRIEMSLDQFRIDVPGRDPNGDGMWTDVSAQVTFRFYGAVIPEPASVVLLMTGLCCAWATWSPRLRR